MRGSCITSLVVSAIIATLPPSFAKAAGGGGHHGFSGPVGSFGLGSHTAYPGARNFSSPGTPGWGSWIPGWGWLGRPSAFGAPPSAFGAPPTALGAPPSGLVLAPFHTPYAAPFWGVGAASIAIKPDEATVLESESPMEEQIRALEAASPKDENSEKGSDAPSEEDRSEWQPL